ncbi:NERD domain-containing protein [Fusibacter sp. JL216-2]|uniref:nuclease-related domain-containing DEAD/DEAH box helicase n=1 Tax=Fusibacter sp. JL216-2 TaxID=3071453 RepID=UPI003D3423AF
MAKLFPDKFPETKQQGEYALAKLMAKYLDTNSEVYYEYNIPTGQVDIILVDRKFGVFIVEVKDWSLSYFDDLVKADPSQIVVRNSNGTMRYNSNPDSQSNRYAASLYGQLKSYEEIRVLNSKNRSNSPICVNRIIAFPNLSKDDFFTLKCPKTDKMFADLINIKYTMFQDDFDLILTSDFDDGQKMLYDMLINRMKHSLLGPITDDVFKKIKATINPRIIIKGNPDSIFTLMEDQQISESLVIPTNDHLIRGVAGSGKTIIMATQAKHILDTYPNAKILYTCFNKSLVGWLKENYFNTKFYSRIEVENFDRKFSNPVNQVYDYIFVDESQDLSKQRLDTLIECRKPLHEDGSKGHIIIASDWAQSIYDASQNDSFDFRSSGLSLSDHDITNLEINYRGTMEIGRFAYNYLESSGSKEKESYNPTHNRFISNLSSNMRRGPLPKVVSFDNYKGEINYILEQISVLTKTYGAIPSDIAIIIHGSSGKLKESYHYLTKQLKNQSINFYNLLNDENKKTFLQMTIKLY